MAKRKIYAVRKGLKTGLFNTWEECKKQVNGYAGAEFKGFVSREEAEAYLGISAPDPVEEEAYLGISVPDPVEEEAYLGVFAPDPAEKEAYLGNSALDPVEKDGKALEIYVDGSYCAETGEFSYGMVVLPGDRELKFSKKFTDPELAQMHNVAGEIKGAEAAFQYALEHGEERLLLYHDYEGIAKWCTGQWRANKPGTRAYKDFYDSVKDRVKVQFVKVAGHSHNKYNDLADALAKEALGLGRERK